LFFGPGSPAPDLPEGSAVLVSLAVSSRSVWRVLLVARWTSSWDWDDRHGFALVFGGVAACMVGGFVIFAVGGALSIDWIGKAVLDVMAILGLARLGRMPATA
jgi:hypothetical protein